ncbi:MAG: phosphoribosyltransferase family protein [Solirubrobacteraceae bacterium]|jgi:predicted phosphoribosyltransferase/predicted alpha/beta-hydrolase family hydrolase
MQYLDRRDAGRQLARELIDLTDERPVIVALPRGGVPVAVEVARELGAQLEILAVRKLGAPGNPELGVGAVAEDGTGVLDPQSAGRLGMTQAMLEETLARESQEMRRRVEHYRDGRPSIPVKGRTVIVVDDGLATGLSDLAAVRALRKRGARRIVVAAPVGSGESISMLAEEADRVVCPLIPERLYGVGMWYRDFAPVSDEEVVALLAEAGQEGTSSAPPPRAPSTSPPSAGAVGPYREALSLEVGGVQLAGDLNVPASASGLVLFAHGSGSSRMSPRNRAVAGALNDAGLATLLFDLLDEQEALRRELVFNVPLLAGRLEVLTRWAGSQSRLQSLPIGYFGASTGAAAALRAAAEVGGEVTAVVSRGGRPDLAADRLKGVVSPTLLIVGARDLEVLELNRDAAAQLRCPHDLVVIDGAGHLFEEPGALERVSELAIGWFHRYLASERDQALSGVG